MPKKTVGKFDPQDSWDEACCFCHGAGQRFAQVGALSEVCQVCSGTGRRRITPSQAEVAASKRGLDLCTLAATIGGKLKLEV